MFKGLLSKIKAGGMENKEEKKDEKDEKKDVWTSVLAASKLLSHRTIEQPKVENRFLQIGDTVSFLYPKSNSYMSSEG